MLGEINQLKKNLNKFSSYNPKYTIKKSGEDFKTIKEKIAADLKSKLESHIVEIDNRFSIENFEYCTNDIPSEKIKEIY